MNTKKVKIISACISNYEGMTALVDTEDRVYLGKSENYHFTPGKEAYYDNEDNSLCFISNNDKIFSFLYSSGWVLSQKEMLQYFTMELYEEFDKLQNGVLKQFKRIQEITFNGKPFISPTELRKQENLKESKRDINNFKYNKDFNKEFEKAKKRFNDICMCTGREHLVLDQKIALANGAKLGQPEAYPEKWTLADLVAESDFQMNFRKEMLKEADCEDKIWIRKELNRWNNFKNHYLPLVKSLNIQLFCNHCSCLDVNEEDTLFYKENVENKIDEEEEL